MSVRETLKLAVEQLFIRIHNNLFNEIYMNVEGDFKLNYDEENESHVKLVQLCKQKIGYKSAASNQEIFSSIMRAYKSVKGKKK